MKVLQKGLSRIPEGRKATKQNVKEIKLSTDRMPDK